MADVVGRIKSRRKTLLRIALLLVLWLVLVPGLFFAFPWLGSSPSAVIYGGLLVLGLTTLGFLLSILTETSEWIRSDTGVLGPEVIGPLSAERLERRANLFVLTGVVTAFVFISLDLIVSFWIGPTASLESRIILEALPTGAVAGISYLLVRRRPHGTRPR